MGEKETKYIEAAIEVFSRYGMRRATMGDIAEKAGVSRQTLYATYANKEEVLKAAICHAARKTMADIEADWKNCTTIAENSTSFLNTRSCSISGKSGQCPTTRIYLKTTEALAVRN